MGVYKCPVCEGRGTVPSNFYSNYNSGTAVNTAPTTCKSCNGRGVIFDTDCFYPHANTPLPDDYTFSYDTICVSNSCSNCGHNDGTIYTSNPVKYKCTLTNEWHEAGHTCKDWCHLCPQLFTGTDVSKKFSDYISLTNLTATGRGDSTIEFVNGTNTTEQTSD